MKKVLSVFLSIIMLLSITIGIDLSAFAGIDEGYVSGDYRYELLEDGTVEILRYIGKNWEAVIPSTILGKTVTSIGNNAFSGSAVANIVENVIIPSSVKSIGKQAFKNCSNLYAISIPSNGALVSIGNEAFYNCKSLRRFTLSKLSNHVRTIGARAFAGCSSLQSVTLSDSLTSIANELFYDCYNLTDLSMSRDLKSIGDGAFKDCTSLFRITIPSSVESIGAEAFYNTAYYNSKETWSNGALYIGGHLIVATRYPHLTQGNYTIESGTVTIAQEAFLGCTGLTSVTIPNSVTSIANYAFKDCTGLTSITIPSSVTTIGNLAFSKTGISSIKVDANNKNYSSENGILYNKKQTELVCYPQAKNNLLFIVPNSVTTIGNFAFSGCKGLTNITIPDSVTSIGDSVFSGCAGLTNISIPNSIISISSHAFEDCSGLTSVTIPSSVKSIGAYAFMNCTGLTSVTIPSGVTSIGNGAFNNCKSLDNIIIPSSVISIGECAFECTSVTSIAILNDSAEIKYLAIPYKATIYGYLDSTAQAYAKDRGNKFESHTYDNGQVTKEATCTENGTKIYTCTECDETITETISVIGHIYNRSTVTKEATCTEEGVVIHTCAVCEETKTEVISAKGHTVVIDAAVEPTCTERGLTEGSHCSVCNVVFTAQEIVPVKGHRIVTDKAVAATCTKTGLTEGRHCRVCNEVFTEQIVVPATGHSYDAGKVTKAATCDAAGVKTYACTKCEATKTEAISAKGHTVVTDKAVAATCTTAGKTAGSHCSVCNAVIKAQTTIPATGHSYDAGKVTKAATCTTAGVKTYTCTKCKARKTETIKATGHKAVTDEAVAATCTTAGKTEGSHCSVCNTVIKAQQTVPATGHSYDEGKITKAATCTANGVKTYTCKKCKATKTEVIKATGHKAVTDKAVAATCTKAGKAEGSHCSVCNAVIKAQKTIPATGHSYDAGKVTKQPTATTAGVKTYTCTKCKATKTETIKATGLKAPTLKVTVNANGTFTLSWNKVAGAEKYELYIKQADGSYKLMKTTNATSFTTAFATYGKQFTYKMRAVAGNTKSAYSAAVNAKNTKKLQTPAMKVTVNANGTFKLSWNAVAGVTSYQLYIRQADGSYKLMKTTNATSFTTAFATYGKQFTYKMRAVTSKNSSATSAYSSAVNAKNTKKLQTPTMKVTVNANGTFKLSWNAVAGATSYQLYIKQADGSYKLMKTTNATSFTTATAAYGKQYTYKMRAVTSKNSSATSAYSSAVNAKNTKKLQAPSLKVAVNKNGSFKLSWGKVTGATSYQLYIKQANGSYKLMKTTSSTSFTTAVAAKGKTYSYKVRAVTSKNKNATSSYSNVVSAKRK